MKPCTHLKLVFPLLLIMGFCFMIKGQRGNLSGNITLDSSWSPKVYLSHIPSFQEMYSISEDMILAEAPINDSGNFSLNLNFISEDLQLFRLHIRKKTNSRASLIIGGEDENHLFFLASNQSQIELINQNPSTPFDGVEFFGSKENIALHELRMHIKKVEAQASKSNSAKRRFLNTMLQDHLIKYADSSSFPLVAAYALFETPYEQKIKNNPIHYRDLIENWSLESAKYSRIFKDILPEEKEAGNSWWPYFALLLLPLGIYLGSRKKQKKGLKKLSVQEYKIYEHLKQGASNQEISDEFNIGVSTVKSHVSSILSKLKVKSRKDLLKKNPLKNNI